MAQLQFCLELLNPAEEKRERCLTVTYSAQEQVQQGSWRLMVTGELQLLPIITRI
jgi:hypothetical protein